MSQVYGHQSVMASGFPLSPPYVSEQDGLPYGTCACGRRGEIYNDGLCERCHETDEEERRERFDAENEAERFDGGPV